MIDCPICHIKNEDDARFCFECGQRLNSGMPPVPAQQAGPPPQISKPRLHSPLLANAGAEPGSSLDEHHGGDSGEVNRLKQLASRQQDKPLPQQPEYAFKNPFDPRNSGHPETPQGPTMHEEKPSQTNPPKSKLRSPLLAGDEYDEEEDEYQPEPKPQTGKGGNHLHSPLLGGGSSGGGAHLRSPLLGGSNFADEQDDEPASGTGGQFRSPLLGGGGGGFSGERRQGSAQPYPGHERRGSGLRSPILGGADDYYEDEEAYDEEPLDENNPNVLRSPLLAARRPVDRPQPPSKPVQPGINPSSPQPDFQMGKAPAAEPMPAPTYQPTAPSQPPVLPPTSPTAAPVAPAGYATAPQGYQYGTDALNQSRSPSPRTEQPQQDLKAPWPQTPSFPGQAPTGGFGTVGQTDSARHVQPPQAKFAESGTAQPVLTSSGTTPKSYDPEVAEPSRPARVKSRMLSNSEDDYQEESYEQPPSRYTSAIEQASPVPKIIGGVAVILLLMEAWAFMGLMQDPNWSRIAWLTTHYMATMGALVCIIVFGFTSKR